MKLLIKDINIKTLVSGDKTARIVLETLWPDDVKKLAQLSGEIEIEVDFKKQKK